MPQEPAPPAQAAEADPDLDTRLDPPEDREGEAAAETTPLRARPQHPYWLGKPITESAIRGVHLWPRTKPAPAAVVASAKAWGAVLKSSRAAFDAQDAAAAVEVVVRKMAHAYRTLACGGAPPRELVADPDYPDLSPTDPVRVEFDTAVLLIAKAQVAINQAYDRGGAWRAAVEDM